MFILNTISWENEAKEMSKWTRFFIINNFFFFATSHSTPKEVWSIFYISFFFKIKAENFIHKSDTGLSLKLPCTLSWTWGPFIIPSNFNNGGKPYFISSWKNGLSIWVRYSSSYLLWDGLPSSNFQLLLGAGKVVWAPFHRVGLYSTLQLSFTKNWLLCLRAAHTH